MPEALKIRDLTVDLGRGREVRRVLDGVSLEVAPGEIVALVGESGSGKTTIGLAAQGLLPRSAVRRLEGSIRVGGEEVVGASAPGLRRIRRRIVRVVPQDPMRSLDPTMRVGPQLREAGGTGEEATVALRRMGLPDSERVARAHPWRLSGGQRQRVMIAMALLARPRLIVADEPTTALDVTVQAEILALLREIASDGTGILFVTHDLGVAGSLADRVIVCAEGRIVEAGPTARIVAAPSHPATRSLVAARFDLETDRSRPLPVPGAERPAPWPAPRRDPAPAFALSGIVKGFPHGRAGWRGRRGSTRVLGGVDLAVARGECVALVGESGSGKSTLLRIVAGLEAPDAGTIERAQGPPPQVVFQDAAASLTPWLPVGRQIAERVGGDAARAREAMAMVGLDPDLAGALPGEMSGGQCQRAAVARAVVDPPAVLLCDEPVSAMDVSLAAQILNLLGELRRRIGMGMLFVTHDLAAARLAGDRIAVLEAGRIVEEGPAEAIVTHPRAPYTRKLLAAVPRLRPRAAA